MAKNADLGAARTAKKDEFYTQLTDIEKEMRYYDGKIADYERQIKEQGGIILPWE